MGSEPDEVSKLLDDKKTCCILHETSEMNIFPHKAFSWVDASTDTRIVHRQRSTNLDTLCAFLALWKLFGMTRQEVLINLSTYHQPPAAKQEQGGTPFIKTSACVVA